MFVKIPYHLGMNIGCTLDARTLSKLDANEKSFTRNVDSKYETVNEFSSNFSIITSIDDLCQVLDIPIEYALKVDAGIFNNETVSACLQSFQLESAVTVIFRLNYVKVRQVLSNEKRLLLKNLGNTEDSHRVKYFEVGSEIVLALSFACDDGELLKEFVEEIESDFTDASENKNNVARKTTKALQSVNNILKRAMYRDLAVTMKIISFNTILPSSIPNLISVINNFTHQCELWGKTDNIIYNNTTLPSSKVKMLASAVATDLNIEDKFSYGDNELFFTRAVLQYIKAENPTETSSKRISKALLYPLCRNVKMAFQKTEELFKMSEFTQPRAIFDRTQTIVHLATKAKNVIRETIINFDYHNSLSVEEWSKLTTIDALKEVSSYIKEIKECLPKGKDIQILIVGKTGQGKSVTASRIIETEDAFKSSPSTKSETDTASCKYNVIDDRLLTVVDTPGVIDTAFNAKDAASIAHAVRCISHGITLCRGGFHALVIVMKYNIRMTAEEKNAIKLVKAVLGEDVLETHGIILFTYGDTCEDFQAYLNQKHDPTFKQLITECKNRCVLFDNKTEDKLKRKEQLIKLVKLVDSLNAPCLDNETFQRAEETRNQYIANNPLLSQAVSESMKCIETTLLKLSSNKPKETDPVNIKSFLDHIEHINTILSDKQGENVQNLKEGLEEIKNEIKAKGDMNITQLSNTQKVMKVVDILKEENDKINRFVNDVVEGEVRKNSCFPSNAVLTLMDGTIVYTKDLQIGDKVLARDKTGKLIYDEVYMFGHLEPNVLSWFVTLHTTEQHVSLSEDHLVVCKRGGQERTIPAKDIIIGDCLFVLSGTELINSPVINISRSYDEGLYAPFTKSGTIIVNNALMSCYVDILNHDSCHKLLGPIRSLHTIYPKLLTTINQQEHSKYIPKWVDMALKVIKMFKKQNE